MRLKTFGLFISFILVSFCYSFFFEDLICDEIWNYGVSYNISLGMVPYRDFNLVTTPLYPMLASVFINIFGHHIYSFELFNSFVIALVFTFCYSRIGKKVLILYPIVLIYSCPGYNPFSLLCMFILLIVCDSDIKYKDIVLGFIVGIIFLTKQSIGVCLLVPLIWSCQKKWRGLIGFLFPVLFLIIYLMINNATYEFVDYCFFGLLDFNSKNRALFPPFLVVWLILIIFLSFKFFLSRGKDKEIFFILAYQIIAYPIMDDRHLLLGLSAYLFYILLHSQKVNVYFKYYLLISIAFFISYNCVSKDWNFYHFYDINNSYLDGKASFREDDNEFYAISEYVDNHRSDYDYIFIFASDAYKIKMNIDYPLSKFDMICNGNMGYNGAERYISEFVNICEDANCLFLLDSDEGLLQTSRVIYSYVEDNYQEIDKVYQWKVYFEAKN